MKTWKEKRKEMKQNKYGNVVWRKSISKSSNIKITKKSEISENQWRNINVYNRRKAAMAAYQYESQYENYYCDNISIKAEKYQYAAKRKVINENTILK